MWYNIRVKGRIVRSKTLHHQPALQNMKKSELKYGIVTVGPDGLQHYFANGILEHPYGAMAEVIKFQSENPHPVIPTMFHFGQELPCPIHYGDDAGSLGDRFEKLKKIWRLPDPKDRLENFLKFLVPVQPTSHS